MELHLSAIAGGVWWTGWKRRSDGARFLRIRFVPNACLLMEHYDNMITPPSTHRINQIPIS